MLNLMIGFICKREKNIYSSFLLEDTRHVLFLFALNVLCINDVDNLEIFSDRFSNYILRQPTHPDLQLKPQSIQVPLLLGAIARLSRGHVESKH